MIFLSFSSEDKPVVADLVILASGDRRVDEGDVGNKQLYCDKRLDADSQAAAEAQAEKLKKQIKGRR